MSTVSDPADMITDRERHVDEIGDSVGYPDLIDPELIDESMIMTKTTDRDGVEILFETDDGHLIRAHRPSASLIDDPDADDVEPPWIVDRAGDFSTVI